MPQKFDFLLALDFEATCLENRKIEPVQEIIEFQLDSIIKIKSISSHFRCEPGTKQCLRFHIFEIVSIHSKWPFCNFLNSFIFLS